MDLDLGLEEYEGRRVGYWVRRNYCGGSRGREGRLLGLGELMGEDSEWKSGCGCLLSEGFKIDGRKAAVPLKRQTVGSPSIE